MTTLLIENPHAGDHITPPGHPEQRGRYHAVMRALDAPEFANLIRQDAPLATDAMLHLAHPPAHIDDLRALMPLDGVVSLDADTYASPATWQAAQRGAGGCVAAVDAVLDGRADNAFVVTRPPGHHAEKTRAMGFCLFSNIAIAAKYAIDMRGLSRVAIVDFDVHHGNGTQDVVWDDPDILFISTHQMPLYPGTGGASETGVAHNIANFPLDPGSTGADMQRVYDTQIFPRLRDWRPEMILISAGFDAHVDDPLANLAWQTDDFAWLTEKLRALADELCEGRLISTLEGGYDLGALAESVAAHLRALMRPKS
jgi:acetoin utilization deacetylase AcuC-like enzyme